MTNKAIKMVMCKLASGELKELSLSEGRALRKTNHTVAKEAGEPTFDGVMVCEKCGYTKRYINNQCYGCKRLKVQEKRNKTEHLAPKTNEESQVAALESRVAELEQQAKDRIEALKKVSEEAAQLRTGNQQQADEITRLLSETEEKNSAILALEQANQQLEETNRQLGAEMLELL